MAFAAIFSDVPESAWYTPYIHQASDLGIVSGYKNAQGNPLGIFKPSANVTLAEALKIASEGAGYNTRNYPILEWEDTINHWVAPYYRIAIPEGFATFVGANEDVNEKATRLEVAGIIVDAFLPGQRTELFNGTYQNPYKDISTEITLQDGTTLWGWNGLILKLTEDGIVSGDKDAQGNLTGYFRRSDFINRAEMVKIVMSARKKYGMPGLGRSATEETPTPPSASDVKTYTNKQYGFTFKYPSSVNIYDQGIDGGMSASLSLAITDTHESIDALETITVRVYTQENWPGETWNTYTDDEYVKYETNGKFSLQIFGSTDSDPVIRQTVMSTFQFLK